ncbi:V-type ATPase subunit [Meiothermus sp. CFH 77666]|uniref:V-type ATPase subunit n=1 Tax=Meiothermus sp. CFH 77666 TaxID=2817942 RepID=UPI001AA08DC1|nr:V-type ATPase subunit [Meiothermus sp. CFH 77666]MBO1437565.1 V-type ATPase subunit [Meiothermus sp. CFH 77666]
MAGSGFAYLNARLRARRNQVVPEAFFQQALGQSFPDFVRSLNDTVYGPDLVGDSLADVDRAVTNHMQRMVGDLPGLVSGNMREAVSLLLLQSDLINLKTILRGRAAGQSAEEIKGKLGSGTLSEALINALLQAPDAASMAQVLQLPTHPLAKALRNAATGNPDPLALEVALDRDFYAHSLEKARRLREPALASYFALQVDALNLATAFKLHALGVSGTEGYFVPGGSYVSAVLFNRVAGGDFGAMEALNGTPLAAASSARTLGDLERALRRVLLEKAAQGGKDTLGAGLALDYIRRKEWEGARIRLLARRAYFNLPADAVAKEVA